MVLAALGLGKRTGAERTRARLECPNIWDCMILHNHKWHVQISGIHEAEGYNRKPGSPV